MTVLGEEDISEIRTYVKRYKTKFVTPAVNESLPSIWDFAQILKYPVETKEIPYLSAPVEILWETTYLCDHRCFFCYSKDMLSRKEPVLTTEEAKTVIDDAHDMKVIELAIEGGEPFMRRDMLEILEYIRNNTSMQRAGFTHVIVGVESFSRDSIAVYNKGSASYVDKAYDAIPRLLSRGIMSQLNIIICHPYEDYPNVIKAIECCGEFAKVVEAQGFSFVDAPVGTICINYPSANYFRVMNDPNFHIVYHKVPECLGSVVPSSVAECVKLLPYVAIREDFSHYSTANKVTLSSKIYGLWSADATRTLYQKVASLSQHSALILKAWKNHNVAVRFIKEVKEEGVKSKSENNVESEGKSDSARTYPIHSLLSRISREPATPVSSILTEIEEGRLKIEKEKVVPLLLTLTMQGIIEFERGRDT